MSSPKKPKPAAKTGTAAKKNTVAVTTEKIAPKDPPPAQEEILFVREYWTGDSRDGALTNGDGYHYYRMTKSGKILEAYESYELEDGRECASPCPEMLNVHWIDDLGYEDFEILDTIKEFDFSRVKDIASGIESF